MTGPAHRSRGLGVTAEVKRRERFVLLIEVLAADFIFLDLSLSLAFGSAPFQPPQFAQS
jgi:hypothetical protein